MNQWLPVLTSESSPRYLAIVEVLEADISAGRIKPGSRLLPQRDMATRLGLSVGTISKAYAEAERRGLISGEVGRGTFVLGRGHEPGVGGEARPHPPVNLALNVPPSTGEDALIAAVLAEMAADGGTAELLGYLPHQGRRDHREAIAGWLGAHAMPVDADQLFVTHGAQHAISLALSALAKPGEIVAAEAMTYSGMIALAAQTGCRLHGAEIDDHGLLPDALEGVLASTGARVVYAMPTLQTPTGVVMPDARREAIAEIIRKRDAFLIEDDAYGFLFTAPPRPLSALIPERSFYAVSFAKCLAPGLRIGAMVAPDAYRDRIVNGLRATGWMATPIMAELVKRLILNGGLAEQVREKREQAAARVEIARRVLGHRLRMVSAQPGFHVWLELGPGRTITGLIGQAAQAGITLAAPAALRPLDPANVGLRLCLGGAASKVELERVLRALRNILDNAEEPSIV